MRVTQKGFRTKRLVVVTTLLDAEEHSADEIAEVYRRRWQAELHLRSLKTVRNYAVDKADTEPDRPARVSIGDGQGFDLR